MACFLADYGLLMFLSIREEILLSLYRYCVFVCEYVYIYMYIYIGELILYGTIAE